LTTIEVTAHGRPISLPGSDQLATDIVAFLVRKVTTLLKDQDGDFASELTIMQSLTLRWRAVPHA
jgi:hypothetical protein